MLIKKWGKKKLEKVGFKFKGKKIEVEARGCNLFTDVIGLMFSRRENASALLFHFSKPVSMRIHSMFVFFPFVAVWLDENNEVIQIKTIKSWKFGIRPKKKFVKLIEIPINKRYEKIVKLLVGS